MDTIELHLLRGVCQIPAYIAVETGLFAEQGIEATVKIAPTAWMVPQALGTEDNGFAVIPWTRAAAANQHERRLLVVTGSGADEAAIVVRKGLELADVASVSVPMRGGMKDLTAMGMLKSLGWADVEILRQPSGDGSIIAFAGDGVDAASMVEPYATMLVDQGRGYVARRTGDLWPGAPGCSLTTSAAVCDDNPDLVRRVVAAYARATERVVCAPADAAAIARRYIGIGASHIEKAIRVNPPRVDAIRNLEAMDRILALMVDLGYLSRRPEPYCDLRFLDAVSATA